MPAERFDASRFDAEAKHTQTEGLPLFEWARSEEMRAEGKRVIAEEAQQDDPDFRYIADVAGTLDERLPQRVAQAAQVQEMKFGSIAEEREGHSVQAEVRALVSDEQWQHHLTDFKTWEGGVGRFDLVVAASLRAIDAERFDREVSSDVRGKLWEELWGSVRGDRRGDITETASVQLMHLEELQWLDAERFAEAVHLGDGSWQEFLLGVGRELAEGASDRALYVAAAIKRVFGADAFATYAAADVARRWDEMVQDAQRLVVRAPESGILAMADLQRVALEGDTAPHVTWSQWEAAKMGLQWLPPPIQLPIIALLQDIALEE